MKRRVFLLAGAGVAGALIVGWGVRPPRARLNADSASMPLARGEVQLNGWLKISTEGVVTIAVPRAEMGQGVYTALPMLVAEELGCDWSQVAFAQAPVDKMYGNVEVMAANAAGHPDERGTTVPEIKAWIARKVGRELGIMITGGSSSVKDAWEPMRNAGAAARDMLIQAAAVRFKADAKECKTVKGWVVHSSGLKASFGELAAAAAKLTPSLPVKLKDAKDFTIIGKNLPRLDTRAKVTGQAEFGLDVRLPNMLYATIRMAPVFGAGWAKFYANGAETMPGVKAVLPVNPGMAGAQCGIAVIAEAWWQAKCAADALDIVWDTGSAKHHGKTSAGLDSAAIFNDYRKALDAGSAHTYFSRGKMGEALALSIQEVSAEYRVPYLAHATMEPQNCTAWIRDDGEVEVWAPTQAPSIAQWIAAKAAGVKTHQVTVHSTFLGGGFGRRGEMDMVVQAVELAKTTGGRPVQLIWSREEDTTHDMYRPAALAQLTAGLDGAGNVVWWRSKSASGSVIHSITGRMGFPPAGPDRTSAEGLADKVYEIPHVRIEHVQVDHPVPLGPWRSVGHSQNAFFAEHFLDELAARTGQDPLDYRRNLLKNHPRHLAPFAEIEQR